MLQTAQGIDRIGQWSGSRIAWALSQAPFTHAMLSNENPAADQDVGRRRVGRSPG